MKPEQSQFHGLFKREAVAHLQQLQRGLLVLKHHLTDETVLGEMTQSADTLMGSAITMGFEETSRQARTMRERLAAAREGKSPLDAAALDGLWQRLHTICAFVDAAVTAEVGDAVVSQTTMMTMRSALDQLQHEILRLEQYPHDAAVLTRVRALALTLKEHAETSGLDAITLVVQRTDNVLRVAAAGALTINADIRGLLLQGLGFIELLLETTATGKASDAEIRDLCTMLDERLPVGTGKASLAAGDEKPGETPDMGREALEDAAVRRKVRVLIASHSTLFSRMLSHIISQEQHEVVLTSDADEVVSYLKKKTIDLCFVRDALPKGLDTCEQSDRGPEVNHAIPIIVFSPLSRMKSRALETGACGFLKVPCQPQEVLALIDRWGKRPRVS